MTDISVIIPIYNGEKWINKCLQSIAIQSVFRSDLNVEIIIYNDGSIDETQTILKNWAKYFFTHGISFIFVGSTISNGVGVAKNGAVKKSTGKYLCFQDIDDEMHPDRIILQYRAAKCNHKALIGSRISRVPVNSTPRFVRWANNLDPTLLKKQIYTSNGPTLLMPTWFCHRSVFEKVGGFSEAGQGTPEDLIFFHEHLELGGDLHRVDEELVIYTYHEGATTFSIKRETIWRTQLDQLERHVLPYWNNFTVWNAGKWGRRLIRSLSPANVNKVVAFCDVDKNKIGCTIELYCPIKRAVKIRLPVIHFSDAKPPLLICVKLDLTNGEFERNLKSLNLREGIDYVLFS